jgi:hypothetical protein
MAACGSFSESWEVKNMFRKLSGQAMLGLALLMGAIITLMLATEACAAGPQTRIVPLSAQEQADLLYMREEEKVARDVYLTLSALWKTPIFSNIAASEQNHMDSILNLLNRYGLADPVAGMGVGRFATEEFQTMYDELVSWGSQSLLDALKVGCTIEEIDIIDLWNCMDATTHQDLFRVYQNLEAGSENHLRAFVGQLASRGVTYEPLYLTQEQYQQIINP